MSWVFGRRYAQITAKPLRRSTRLNSRHAGVDGTPTVDLAQMRWLPRLLALQRTMSVCSTQRGEYAIGLIHEVAARWSFIPLKCSQDLLNLVVVDYLKVEGKNAWFDCRARPKTSR
jgi:hypothetical protein